MKLTRGALSGTVRHDERGGEDRFVTRKNESIDPARTHMNYSLTPPALQLTPLERVNELCETEGINIAKRKDLNVAVSWVVTLPPSVTEVEQERFFYETKRFLDAEFSLACQALCRKSFVHFPEGNPAEDLCLLSKCHNLIGPPSTFTLVASMYQNLPLYWIEDPDKEPTPSDFRYFDDLFRHII